MNCEGGEAEEDRSTHFTFLFGFCGHLKPSAHVWSACNMKRVRLCFPTFSWLLPTFRCASDSLIVNVSRSKDHRDVTSVSVYLNPFFV